MAKTRGLKNRLLAGIFVLALSLSLSLGILAPTAQAATPSTPADCSVRILSFPTWFRGLVKVEGGECVIVSPGEAGAPDLSGFIWRIVLNVIEILLQAVGYIAAFFIIFGGFQFLTGGANPGQIEKARVTLLNAIIGLAISIGSIGLVNLIFGIIG